MAESNDVPEWAPTKIEERSVLIVGKTGAGKSTLGNHLLKDDKFPVSDSFNSTGHSVSHGVAEGKIEGNARLKCKVVDTVGLFDTTQLSNKKVMKDVKLYVNQHLPEGINIVLFVFRKGRFTREEKDTFDFISKRFGKDIRDISALIITHCENDAPEAREQLIHDFHTNTQTSNIAALMGKGIYAVGFPNTSSDDLLQIYRPRMARDEAALRKLIIESEKSFLATQLIEEPFWDKCWVL